MRSIKIGAVTFPVNLTSKKSFNDYALYSMPIHGGFDSINGIQVNPELTHSKKCVILTHEILHAILESLSIEMTEEFEERIVNDMAILLTQVIQDNPEYIDYVTKKTGNSRKSINKSR